MNRYPPVRRRTYWAAPVLFWVIASLCWVPKASAQNDQKPKFRVGGLVFGDFYKVTSHHLDNADGAAGLVVRRGYLTFDADITKRWFARVRFELNQSGEFETYRFDVDTKDLYAGVKLRRHRLIFGLSPTPTFDVIESIWGFRYLVRTPLDLQGVASRETGIAIRGPLNASGTLSYRTMVGADIDFGNETGDGRKWMGALNWRPAPRWILDLYGDYENRTGATDRATFQVFTGYQTEKFRWGAQYSNVGREDSPRLELASGFAVYRLAEWASLVGRVDRIMEPSPKGNNISYLPFDPTSRATFFIGGTEFRVKSYLYVTPNVVVTYYDRNDEGIRPTTDQLLRLTLYFKFE